MTTGFAMMRRKPGSSLTWKTIRWQQGFGRSRRTGSGAARENERGRSADIFVGKFRGISAASESKRPRGWEASQLAGRMPALRGCRRYDVGSVLGHYHDVSETEHIKMAEVMQSPLLRHPDEAEA